MTAWSCECNLDVFTLKLFYLLLKSFISIIRPIVMGSKCNFSIFLAGSVFVSTYPMEKLQYHTDDVFSGNNSMLVWFWWFKGQYFFVRFSLDPRWKHLMVMLVNPIEIWKRKIKIQSIYEYPNEYNKDVFVYQSEINK